MSINVIGKLLSPLGDGVPNQDIRITSCTTGETVKNTVSSFSTDVDGNYNFNLENGLYNLEILIPKSFKVVGTLWVDDSTPITITLPELIWISREVATDGLIEYPEHWEQLFTALENSHTVDSKILKNQMSYDNAQYGSAAKLETDGDIAKGTLTNIISSREVKVINEDVVYSDGIEELSASSKTLVNKHGLNSTTIQLSDSIVIASQSDSKKNINETDTIVAVGDISLSEAVTAKSKTKVSNQVLTTQLKETVDNNVGTTSNAHSITQSITDITSWFKSKVGKAHKYIETTIKAGLINEIINHTVNDKSHNDSTTVDTIGSARRIDVDKFNIGNTLEVTHGKVLITGSLQIDKLLDHDGNEINPSDGDTIFQVSLYAETPTSIWHDNIQPNDKWKKDNLSVNGKVDPDTWSIPYRFVGVDGNAGDTILLEYEYSPDAQKNWTSTMKTGDKYRRERIVRNGVAGPWSEPALIAGHNGVSVEVRSEYSIDGIYNWHPILNPTDKFERRATFENDKQVTPWSDPYAIGKGDAGATSFSSFVYKRTNTKPATPTGGSYINPVPDGWSDGIPNGEEIVWVTTRKFGKDDADTDSTWKVPAQMTDTASIDYEFSTVATNPGDPTSKPSNWSNSASSATIWMAVRTKKNGIWSTWSVNKIKGEMGADGANGENGKPGIAGQPGANGKPGSGWYTLIKNGGNWTSDTQATADFVNTFGRSPQENDHLFYVDKYPAPIKSTGKRCNSKEGAAVTWSTPALAVNGDMLVDGCISARNIVAGSITGNHISAKSTILAGSGSWTAGMNGDDNHPSSFAYYNNWRMWSGATKPNEAPFRVFKDGTVYANKLVLGGTIPTQITTAQNAANSAQGTANSASTAASNAQGTASSAASAANSAQSSANSAQSAASAAQSSANSASSGVTAINNKIYVNQSNLSIKSGNYVSGKDGWAIDNSGVCEFNKGIFRGELQVGPTSGSRLRITSDRIEVYEGNSLRVVVGRL